MYSSVIERMFYTAMRNGLFKTGYPILALVYGYEILIKATPSEGIEIYSDYPNVKEFAVMHHGGTLEGFGTGFSAVELRRVMLALVEKTATDGLVIDTVNGPGIPLALGCDRFREICNEARVKPQHRFGFRGFIAPVSKTLDQWFSTKGK